MAIFAVKKFHNDVIERNILHQNKSESNPSLLYATVPTPVVPATHLKPRPVQHASRMVIRPEPRPPRQPAPPQPTVASLIDESNQPIDKYLLPTEQKDKIGKMKEVDVNTEIFCYQHELSYTSWYHNLRTWLINARPLFIMLCFS